MGLVSFIVALKRPFQDLKTFIIGTILGMIPIVNLLTIPGFALRNAKKSLENDDSLQPWDDWGDIIIKSIVYIVITFIYSLPVVVIAIALLGAIIFSMLGVMIAGTSISTQSISSSAMPFPLAPKGNVNIVPILTQLGATMGAAAIVAIILFLLALFIVFILPMALMHWLRENDFGAAFRVGSVIRKSFTVPYIVAWVFSLITIAIFAIVAIVLSFIPSIGTLVGSGIAAYAINVTTCTLFAQAYRELEQREKAAA